MTIKPFSSDTELLRFSRKFFDDRIGTFRKDFAICLTADKQNHHAYFPALITCIAFVDLVSGLYAGKLEHHGLADLKAYAYRFMNRSNYDSLRLEILYEMFRHKLAHLAYPYVVFDTATKPKRFIGQKPRRITWTVYASKRQVPIELIESKTPQYLIKSVRPWAVSYNSRVLISLRKLQQDIINSIRGRGGYLRALEKDAKLQEKFAACMRTYFPP